MGRRPQPGVDRRNAPELREALMDSCSLELEALNRARSALWRSLNRGRVCPEVFDIRGRALKRKREDLKRTFPLCAALFDHDEFYWLYWDIRTPEEKAASETRANEVRATASVFNASVAAGGPT